MQQFHSLWLRGDRVLCIFKTFDSLDFSSPRVFLDSVSSLIILLWRRNRKTVNTQKRFTSLVDCCLFVLIKTRKLIWAGYYIHWSFSRKPFWEIAYYNIWWKLSFYTIIFDLDTICYRNFLSTRHFLKLVSHYS